jgi:hypothetical protein
MFSKNIKFLVPPKYLEYTDKSIYPIPAKQNMPDWFKKLSNKVDGMTVKHCKPFLDSLVSGYILKMPYDMRIRHNVVNEETGEKDGFQETGIQKSQLITAKYLINFPFSNQWHPIGQLGESPLVEKNKNLAFHKILNPWVIKTPPGFSCLFVPPLNNQDDRFSIIPAIVDTDKHDIEINFPIVVNGFKHDELITTIKAGTPYVQVIPFKRDSWKMSIEPFKKEKQEKDRLNFYTKVKHFYRDFSWSKKSFK